MLSPKWISNIIGEVERESPSWLTFLQVLFAYFGIKKGMRKISRLYSLWSSAEQMMCSLWWLSKSGDGLCFIQNEIVKSALKLCDKTSSGMMTELSIPLKANTCDSEKRQHQLSRSWFAFLIDLTWSPSVPSSVGKVTVHSLPVLGGGSKSEDSMSAPVN